ncbi:hypothetical protein PPERSA_06544 [Pseudocohnilembus persalinus]|uniref:RRM domain-containing protein n=1 Tax=Pseudocohnilembus persalinus TaxID=266149 RepID=A0A0V0QRG0_PSEPJ|nr:hypothetical protein PPERSA_06544 [Pseudocohnilembus persalinus]|eukprot:KRX04910.1 hypothetical protein PPERSA_06544 [Pseudocohnilembus persalinus]
MSMKKLYSKKKGSTEIQELNELFANEPVQIKANQQKQQQQQKKNEKKAKKVSVEEMEIEDILDQENANILGNQQKKQKKNSLDQAIEQEGIKVNKTENLESQQEDEKIENPFSEEDLTVKQKQDRDEKTIFIGNVPLEATKKELIKLFKSYGKIENIRERSVPVRTSKNLSVKARVILKKTVENSDKDNLVKNCYILFQNKEDAEKALEKNGFEFKGNYLRVDSANQKELDFTKTIFIGNLSYNTTENQLRKHFTPCGSILNVRVIRDKETHQGKGFGYVEFEKDEGYQKSLELKGSYLNDRQLRIKKAVPKARLEKKKAKKVEIQKQNAEYAQKRIEQKMRNQAEGQEGGRKFQNNKRQQNGDDEDEPRANKFFKSKQAQQFSKNTMENYDEVDMNNKIVPPPRMIRKSIKKAKKRGQDTFQNAQKAEKKFHARNDKNIFNGERGLKSRKADREKRRIQNSKKPKAQVINE